MSHHHEVLRLLIYQIIDFKYRHKEPSISGAYSRRSLRLSGPTLLREGLNGSSVRYRFFLVLFHRTKWNIGDLTNSMQMSPS
jgi:hypothetical protein